MLDWIGEVTGARSVRRRERIQTLWGGYGELFRVELDGGVAPTAVVKWVRPPAAERDTASDRRKRRSYEVEAAFYRDFAPRLGERARVARMYGARTAGDEWVLVLEDLDAAGYTVRHDEADAGPLAACLGWLAELHAQFLGDASGALWPRGTYWHLATRTDELAAIADAELRAMAGEIDARLAAARYQTIVHGDPKEANFCFARDGRVAAVDFQYAGRSCAMVDVAYLLHGRTDEPDVHLDTYFARLRMALAHRGDVAAIEAEWRSLYPLACLDFCRFLAGWSPASWHRDRHRVYALMRVVSAKP